MTPKRLFVLLLAGVTFLAAALRFYQLTTLPPGLWFDEAMNGISALKVVDGGPFKAFYPENFGREGLLISVQAILLHYFPPEPWVLRFPSALMGALTIPILGLFAFEIARHHEGREEGPALRIAAFSAVFMATSLWHLIQSRLAVRTVSSLLFLLAGLWLAARALRLERPRWALALGLLAGVVFGAGAYTYLVARITPLIALALALILWRGARRPWHVTAGFVLGILLVVAPLGLYFLDHPEHFLRRVEEVGDPITLSSVAGRFVEVLDLTFVSGTDFNRHNLDRIPQIPVAVWVPALWGLVAAALLRLRSGASAPPRLILLAGVFFFVGLIPGLFVQPGSSRLILCAPGLFILLGIGAEGLVGGMSALGIHRRAALGVVVAGLVALGSVTAHQLFVSWGQDPQRRLDFVAQGEEVARFVLARPEGAPVYIVRGEQAYLPAATVRYMTRTYDGKTARKAGIAYVNPPCPLKAGAPGACIFLSETTWEVMGVGQGWEGPGAGAEGADVKGAEPRGAKVKGEGTEVAPGPKGKVRRGHRGKGKGKGRIPKEKRGRKGGKGRER